MDRYHRRSIRLKGSDYSKPGYYFVTVCTRERESIFGKIIDFSMVCNQMGEIVEKVWSELPIHFPKVKTDQFIIMPNHMHGIIQVIPNKRSELSSGNMCLLNQAPIQGSISEGWIMMKSTSVTLGKIIRNFKAKSTREIRNKMNNSFCWQRNYFEHIIRDKNELFRIREYILDNPENWSQDDDNLMNGH